MGIGSKSALSDISRRMGRGERVSLGEYLIAALGEPRARSIYGDRVFMTAAERAKRDAMAEADLAGVPA